MLESISKSFPIYQTMLVFAAVFALIMLNSLMKKGGFSKFVKKRVRSSLFWASVLAIIFSNISNWFFHSEILSYSLVDRFAKGGISFITWMLCFFGFSALFLRLYKLDIKKCIDVVIPPLLFATFFARLGCTFAGCCYGIDVSAFGTTFKFPISLVEAVFVLIFSIILFNKFKDYRLRIYLISYPLFRFFAEFLRGDDRGSIFEIQFFSPTQIISLAIILVLLVIVTIEHIVKKRKQSKLNSIVISSNSHNNSDHTEPIQKVNNTQTNESPKNKKYTPRPVNFDDPRIKSNPLKIVLIIFLILGSLIGFFFWSNPFNFTWVTNTNYHLRTKLGFLFDEGGYKSEIGESVSFAVIDSKDKGSINNSEEAISLIKSYDSWNSSNFVHLGTKNLSNGNKMYTFIQTINDIPIFNKTASLIVSQDNQALYVIRDAANDSYSNIISNDYTRTDIISFSNLVSENCNILNETICYYDDSGIIVPAKYIQIIDSNGNKNGILVDSKNESVIKLFKEDNFSAQDFRAQAIVDASENVIDYIKSADKDKIKKISKIKSKSLNAEKTSSAIESSLCRAYLNCGIKSDIFIMALETTTEIASEIPNLSEQMYCDIFSQTLTQVASDNNVSEKTVSKSVKKIESSFKTSGVSQNEDEKPLQIRVNERKTVLKNSIGSATDVDIFKFSMEDNHSMKLDIDSDICIDIEVYTEAGDLVLTTYVTSENEFALYPENGNSFIIKIKLPEAQNLSWSKDEDYKISVASREETNQIPFYVNSTLYTISSSFASSKFSPFGILFYGDAAFNEEEFLEYSTLHISDNCMTFCNGCTGSSIAPQDSTKICILRKLFVNLYTEKMPNSTEEIHIIDGLEIGSDTVIEVSCFRFIETENGAKVKVKLKVTDSNGKVFSGYSFLKLEIIEDVKTFDFINELAEEIDFDQEKAQKLSNALNLIFSNKYYITEINTKDLLESFGDSFDNISDEKGLSSLYDFWDNESSSNRFLKTFDEEAALNAGHSKERVEEFAKFTVTHNIAYCERIRENNEILIQSISLFNDGMNSGYQIYKIIDDPFGLLIDATDNKVVKSIYRIGKIAYGYATGDIKDIAEAVADEAMDDFVEEGIKTYTEQLNKEVDVLQENIDKIDNKIKQYKNGLTRFEKKYFWENIMN